MYSEQYREHCDYEMGAFRNEQQAAFTLSRMETDFNPDARRIETDLAAGMYVVISEFTEFCKFTDAAIGCKKIRLASFLSRRKAENYARQHGDEDSVTYVLPKKS